MKRLSMHISHDHEASAPQASPVWARARLLLAFAAGFAAQALSAQVFLSFSGGSGTEVTVTWSTPITYTLTGTSTVSGVAPTFVFQSVTNSHTIFPNDGFVAGTAPTYTSTGVSASDGVQTINRFYGQSSAFHDVSLDDLKLRGTGDTANTVLTSGDVFTLSAGSLKYAAPATSSTYFGALPTNGYYNTFIVDAADYRLGNGVSAVPEPSAYAAIAGVAMLGAAAWRRRRGRASDTCGAKRLA